MKQSISYVFAGLLGGALALGGSALFTKKTQTTEVIQIGQDQKEAKAVKPTSTIGQLAHNNGNSGVPTDFSEAADKVMPAVVNVTAITRYEPRSRREQAYMEFFGVPEANKGTGSGVIISNKGYMVTNNHVIEGATEVEVTLYDNRKYKAEVVGTDPSTDLAVLKVDAPDLPTVDMANSDDVKIGEWVLAVGNPFELNFTVTAGIISAKGRNINILGNRQRSIESFIQTDAAVNPGNSGGALVNAQGQLIGINTAIATPTGTYAGYSFAVPINLVKKVVSDLMEYGEVKRGYLGVYIQAVNSELAKNENLSVTEGVYVSELIEGGSAEAAGIKAGDVILKVDGNSTKSVPELQEQIGSRDPGDEVLVELQRSNERKKIKLKLKE
jgi:serine protease Do